MTARTRLRLLRLGPALLVVLPLAGLSLQSDERLHIYQQAHAAGAHPLRVAQYVADRLGTFLDHGNFRPLGRFAEVLVHGVVFEFAEMTGLALHDVLGLIRLVMVVLLAFVATGVVEALMRSAGASGHESLAGLYPLALAAVLVANGIIGGLGQFPHTFIGSVALIGFIALATARDRDMRRRTLKGREYAAMAALGVVAATFYDLVYLAPIIAAGHVAARGLAAGMPPREMLRTAAARRWLALTAGFAAVFVPARIEIARRCAGQDCYAASDLSISPDAVGAALPRVLTGLPPAGWEHNADLARAFGIRSGFADLASNVWLAALLISVAVLAVALARCGRSRGAPSPAADDAHGDAGWRARRLALACAGLGGLVVVLSATLAGLSRSLQERQLSWMTAWRESLLTQVGWSLLIAGCLAGIDVVRRRAVGPHVMRRRGAGPQVVRLAAAAVLAVGMACTLVANWRYAEADRLDPSAYVTSLIASTTINVDEGANGDSLRCDLIALYSDVTPQSVWIAGSRVREALDRLMLDRYGWPYCSDSRSSVAPDAQ